MNIFPDGSNIDAWFDNTHIPSLEDLGKQYIATDYGVSSEADLNTKALQDLIDRVANDGGGVICIPAGTFVTGAIFFKPGVNLYLNKDAILMGSDDISDYPILPTRIEGENCDYFSALINADGMDGFVIAGDGVIDGNGHKAWRQFWLRRKWNPACTNKDEQRARLIYISNSSNVTVAGITTRNSMFWTNHLYRCDHVKYLSVTIEAPGEPINAPSSDAIDLDVCTDVLINGCKISVNDDAVCLKGGKGSYADLLPENGATERVIVEKCEVPFAHSAVTLGSECIHANNLIVRDCKCGQAYNFFRLKLRPDTPQIYENILVENCESYAGNFVNINPWTQFYNPVEREDFPKTYARNITFRNCKGAAGEPFNVKEDESQYTLQNIVYENVDIKVDESAGRNPGDPI